MTDEAGRRELPQEYASLPVGEFGFPGALRDRLVAAILDGRKTTTTCLHLEYELDGGEPPAAGTREVVIDSDGRPVTVIEITDVRVMPLADVDRQHALDEGEGYSGVEDWRRDHERFWHGPEYRQAIGRPGFTVGDGTLVVAIRFRRITGLPFPAGTR